MNHLLIWLVFSPILLIALLALFEKTTRRFGFLPMLGLSWANCMFAIFLLSVLKPQEVLIYQVGKRSYWNGIILAADQISMLFVVLIHVIFFLALIYAKKYIKLEQLKFFTFFYLLQAGLTGMVLTSDLFNLYVFLEIVSIVSYALVAYNKNDYGFEAGFKYLVIGSLASLLVIWGIGIVYATTFSLNLASIYTAFQEVSPLIRGVVFIIFFIGFGVKFALFPFHAWLADAHASAPSPISALLSGVMIKVQLFALIKIYFCLYDGEFLQTLQIHSIIMGLGVASILVGHLMAFKQVNLKRMLAYSTIAHIGYIIVGLGSGIRGGAIGALYHIVNHSLLKSGLFFSAGVLIFSLGLRDVADLKGLYQRNRYLGVFFTLLVLGMVGLPPLNGFLSKWLIIMGVMSANYYIPAAAIALGGILSLTYYLRIVMNIFTPLPALERLKVDFFFMLPIGITVVGSVALFVFGDKFYVLASRLVDLLMNNTYYIQAILGSS